MLAASLFVIPKDLIERVEVIERMSCSAVDLGNDATSRELTLAQQVLARHASIQMLSIGRVTC
jgi:hypothetical protein